MAKKRGPYNVNKVYTKYLPGERYGRLVILEEVQKEERKNAYYREVICLCDCGNKVRVRVSNLGSGNTTSCGCYEKELIRKRHTDRFVGKRFGRLTVVDHEADPNRPDRKRYICKCDCGNMHSAIASDLLRGYVVSCGCYRKEFLSERMMEDITGQTFYELTAIKRLGLSEKYSRNSGYKWLFRCSCGKEIEAFSLNVKAGRTRSCGHIGKSYAEYDIRNWLKFNHIKFDHEATLNELRNQKTGRKLIFDFKIFRRDGSFFLLEHQGEQHYVQDERNPNFGKQQREETDKLKKEYCNRNGITLYETRHDEDYIARLEEIVEYEIEREGTEAEREVVAV